MWSEKETLWSTPNGLQLANENESAWRMQIQLRKGLCEKDQRNTLTDSFGRWILWILCTVQPDWTNEKIYVTHVRQYVCLHLQNGNICDCFHANISLSHLALRRHLYAPYTRIPAASLRGDTARQAKNITRNDCNEQWIFHVVHLNRHSFCSKQKRNNDFLCLIYWMQPAIQL